MPTKTKYGLMSLLAMGGATVVVVAARFPTIGILDFQKHPKNTLCESDIPSLLIFALSVANDAPLTQITQPGMK